MNKEIPELRQSLKYFKRLLFLIKPFWWRILKGFSLGVIVGIIGMLTPYLTKLLIDEVYPTENVTLMQVLVGGILTIGISTSLIRTLQGYYNLYINSILSNSISLMFFNHLQHLKIRFFDEHRVGEILSRFGDINKSLNSVNKVFQTIFVNGIYIVLVPPFLFILQWKLALVAIITLPITIIIITILGKYLRKYWKKTSESYAELNAFQFEMLTHIRTVKSMVLEHYTYQQNKKQLENAFKLQLKAGGLSQLLGLSSGLLHSLNTALYTWLGWTYILSKQMTLGDYIAFTAYIGYLYRPLKEFVNLFSEFQHSSVNLVRTFEYLDKPTDFPPNDSCVPITKINNKLYGNIKIENVSFGYNPNILVLKNINLEIKANTITAIVGPSGSGKTSLMRLLLNMEKLKQGIIRYDNIPQYDISIRELRKQISVIWQEFSMFKGTIYENLTIGLQNVDIKVVQNALKIARIDDLINSLPDKLNTIVAEWGASLSGGQKQRLAIARAIIRDTPIIIFDEATSNIDFKTETEILDSLFTNLQNKTIIFITHRLSSSINADKICLLKDGEIIDNGTHKELMDRCIQYREMYSFNK